MIALQYSPFGYRPADLADELERRRQVFAAELARAEARLSALRAGNAELRRYAVLMDEEWLNQRQVKAALLNELSGRITGRQPVDSDRESAVAIMRPPTPEPGSLPAMEHELAALRAARQQILSGVLSLILPYLALDPTETDATTQEMGDTNG